jgi:hypothetical protein
MPVKKAKTAVDNGKVVDELLPGGSWSDSPGREELDTSHLRGLEEAAAIGSLCKRIELPRLDLRDLHITLVGDSPLICNRWSEKNRKTMLDRQMGRATAGKEPKDPHADYMSSLYLVGQDKGQPVYGFPTIAFKNAAVSACTSLGKAVTKVAARQAFHVLNTYAIIEGTPVMREDMVRLPGRQADVRFRGEFTEWKAYLEIKYNARVLTDEQVVNLFNTAGFAVGIGEWRPQRDGQFGRFHVEFHDEDN